MLRPGHTVCASAHAGENGAKLAVVHVHAPPPNHSVDSQLIALVNVVIHHSGQEIVRRADGVEVSGKVEVYLLHGHDLRHSAAGCPALEPKHRPQRRLPQGQHRLGPQPVHGVRQADAGGGLALTGLGGVDSRDQDQLAPLLLLLPGQPELGHVLAVPLQVLLPQSQLPGHPVDGQKGGALGDFNIRAHSSPSSHRLSRPRAA